MKDSATDNLDTKDGQDHALKLLEYLYAEYRSAERYLHVLSALILGLLAYLWKDISIAELKEFNDNPSLAVYSLSILLVGANAGLGLIYTWYLGVGISICDYENRLAWLPIRPMVQVNLGITGKPGRHHLLLLTPLLIPALAGIMSGLLYLLKFVAPILFPDNISCTTWTHRQVFGVVLTGLVTLSGVVIALPVTLNFRRAIINMLPPRKYEIYSDL